MNDLLFGYDKQIAKWAFGKFKFNPTPYVMAIGVINDDKEVVGAALFQEYNGHNVELAYYGPNTLTPHIVRTLASVAMNGLHCDRMTVRTGKKNKALTKSIKKLGFVYEGIQRRFYGNDDAVMFGLYGNNLARLAGTRIQ